MFTKKIAIGMVGVLLGVGLVAVGPATPALAATCGEGFIKLNHQERGGFLTAANIRSGPSTLCSIEGVGHPGDSVTYYCSVPGNTHYDYSWTYLHDNTTGRSGYTRDDLLVNYGSSVWCS